MAVSKFYQAILDTLQGQTDELRAIPPERLDWDCTSAMLALYRRTSGPDRTALIRAMGQVIEDHSASPAVIAELVNIASGLDLAELEPQVRQLQGDPLAATGQLKDAVTNYLAFRQLDESCDAAPSPNGTSRPRASKSAPLPAKRTQPLHTQKQRRRKAAGG